MRESINDERNTRQVINNSADDSQIYDHIGYLIRNSKTNNYRAIKEREREMI